MVLLAHQVVVAVTATLVYPVYQAKETLAALGKLPMVYFKPVAVAAALELLVYLLAIIEAAMAVRVLLHLFPALL
jgi:hypothetical protein